MAETATEETPATGAVATGKQRPALPEGVHSPIQALNHLKQHKHAEGHPQAGQPMAAADFKSQQMYGYVKNPGKTDPFPVKHYDAEGNVFDAPQVNEHGITTTRPGVKLDEVVTWWAGKADRDKARAEARAEAAKKKAEKAAAKAAKDAAAGETADEEPAEVDGELADGEFEEVDPDLEADQNELDEVE